MWGRVSKLKLRSPYPDNAPISHPMDGSDVYKLIWKVNLSSNISERECTELIHKLSKIKRLKDGYVIKNVVINIIYESKFIHLIFFRFSYNSFSSGGCSEDLYCPLCHLTFSNSTSMEMHFNNYQHIERHQLARNELHVSYKGHFSDIQYL